MYWALAVRGEEYEWGRTDCAALSRMALQIQFGEDILPEVPWWTSARTARVVWMPYQKDGGLIGLLHCIGAHPLQLRPQGMGYPIGSILLLRKEQDFDDMFFPAFGISLGEFVVESDPEKGVYWSPPLDVESAWFVECAEVANG